MKIWICNGDDPNCRKTGCKYHGNGDCDHTTKEEYAAKKRDTYFIRFNDEIEWEVLKNTGGSDNGQTE